MIPIERKSATAEALLTRAEAAAFLNVSPRTLERYDAAGAGPGFLRIGPRLVRYSRAACQAWAAQRGFPHRAAELARGSQNSNGRGAR